MGTARKPNMDPQLEWLAKADLSRFRGKYVAIVGCRVAASGKNPMKVVKQANRRFPGKEALLYKVPAEDILIL